MGVFLTVFQWERWADPFSSVSLKTRLGIDDIRMLINQVRLKVEETEEGSDGPHAEYVFPFLLTALPCAKSPSLELHPHPPPTIRLVRGAKCSHPRRDLPPLSGDQPAPPEAPRRDEGIYLQRGIFIRSGQECGERCGSAA